MSFFDLSKNEVTKLKLQFFHIHRKYEKRFTFTYDKHVFYSDTHFLEKDGIHRIKSSLNKYKPKRPASTVVFFARKQMFWPTFANTSKRDYFLKTSFRRLSTNIISTRDFYILWKRRGITSFCSKFLSHDTEKFCWGTIQCIRKLRVAKKFFPREGDTTILCRSVFVSQYRKTSQGVPLVSQNFWFRKTLRKRGGRMIFC